MTSLADRKLHTTRATTMVGIEGGFYDKPDNYIVQLTCTRIYEG